MVFGYWPSLEKIDYSQKATKSHVTKTVDLWVVWLDLRHTWGQYCHPSNTVQSGFMKKNEGTWLRKTLPIQPFPQTGILFALRYVVRRKKKIAL